MADLVDDHTSPVRHNMDLEVEGNFCRRDTCVVDFLSDEQDFWDGYMAWIGRLHIFVMGIPLLSLPATTLGLVAVGDCPFCEVAGWCGWWLQVDPVLRQPVQSLTASKP